MKLPKCIVAYAGLVLLAGCASFRSGSFINRNALGEMKDEKSKPAFSSVAFSWKQFPFKSTTEFIGLSREEKIPKLYPVKAKDEAYFRRKASDIFKKAGVYDVENGSGTANIVLTSYGKWTYKSLMKGFLVDTAFIMILPRSIMVRYRLAAEGEISGKPFQVEETATLKTTFHLFLFPLYPLLRPQRVERALIRSMLWNLSHKIYKKTKN